MHACVHARMYVCGMYVCTYVFLYVHTHIYLYIAFIYIYIHTQEGAISQQSENYPCVDWSGIPVAKAYFGIWLNMPATVAVVIWAICLN